MAKQVKKARQMSGSTATKAVGVETVDAIGQRAATFAKQLERLVRTLQAKAKNGMTRDALYREIARVRDHATDLLERLPSGKTKKAVAVAAVGRNRGRSGGAVDAPGKRHRRPMPTDPGANIVDSQAAKMRTIKTMVKTSRHRGRG